MNSQPTSLGLQHSLQRYTITELIVENKKRLTD